MVLFKPELKCCSSLIFTHLYLIWIKLILLLNSQLNLIDIHIMNEYIFCVFLFGVNFYCSPVLYIAIFKHCFIFLSFYVSVFVYHKMVIIYDFICKLSCDNIMYIVYVCTLICIFIILILYICCVRLN